jgi:YD repeat-containing protein
VLERKYDELGRVTHRIDPLKQEEKYYYDANNNLVQKTDRNGKTFTYEYNSRNFLLKSIGLEETIQYDYLADGTRKSMTEGTGTTNYHFKATGELEKVVFPDSQHIQHQYDENGNRLSMTSPFGNTTHYKYNNVNQLVSVGLSPTEQEVNYSYMRNGQLSEKKQANGVTSKYSYNGYKLDTLQDQALDGTILNTYSYKYDGNGNRQTLASDQLPTIYTLPQCD